MDKTIYLNSEQFYLRLKHIRTYFYSKRRIEGNIAFLMGKHSTKDEMGTDSALFLYLLGYEFPDTFIILNEKEIGVLTSESKQTYIKTIKECPFKFYSKNNEADLKKMLDDFSKDIFIIEGLRNNNNFTSEIIRQFNIRYLTANNLFFAKDIYEVDLYKTILPVIYYKFNRNILDLFEKEFYRTVDLDYDDLLDDRAYNIDNEQLDYSNPPVVENHNEYITYAFPLSFNGYNFTFARTVLLSHEHEKEYRELFSIRSEILADFSSINKYKEFVELSYSGLLVESITDFSNIEKSSILNLTIRKDNLVLGDVIIFGEMEYTRDILSKESIDQYFAKSKRPVRRQTEQLAAQRRAEISTSRQDHQKQLMEKIVKENLEQLENNEVEKESIEEEKIILYGNPSQVRRDSKFIIDEKFFMLNIPLKEYVLPIHVSFLKTISKNMDIIRLNFKETENIKNISYCSSNATDLFNRLTDLRKNYNLHRELKNIEEQEELMKGVLFATSINIKTDTRQPKKLSTGRLEIYKNGIKYIAHNEIISILFSNVERAICNLHKNGEFHMILRSPILFNKKKTHNFQIYRDFGEVIIDTGKYISAEEERQKEERLASSRVTYKEDIKHIIALLKDKINIEIAKITGFNGVPFRAQTYIQVTETGLISFENPFFTLSLENIEVVIFERIIYGLTSFDLIFIYKNKIKFAPIYNVGVENLNYLRSFFDNKNLPYIENSINLKWNVLLKTIRADLVDFYKQGGWCALQPDEETIDSSTGSEVSLYSSSVEDESVVTSTDEPVSDMDISDEYVETESIETEED